MGPPAWRWGRGQLSEVLEPALQACWDAWCGKRTERSQCFQQRLGRGTWGQRVTRQPCRAPSTKGWGLAVCRGSGGSCLVAPWRRRGSWILDLFWRWSQ